ncbi:endonuclease/exonuclease/phosphatase family protein, partial [Trifolium medium]|nr:endonuclease/exonuclease/phosphatase family protein [Trifolium medium]
HANKIEETRIRLGFDASFAVDKIGRSGGLAVLWKHPFVCNIINYSTNFINLEVIHPTLPRWRFTGFYGYPDTERRRDSWDLLRTLAQDNSLPWCIMGDFNDLLSNDEKRSKVDHPPWRIRGFRDAVQDSNLVDLPIIGYPFTWVKGRGTNDMKEERLDRAMATPYWLDLFQQCQLHNVIADRSDHSPILLKLHEVSRSRTTRDFKFENSWLLEEDLEMIVKEGWEKEPYSELITRLTSCSHDMNEWGRKLRNKYRKEIEECRMELERLRGTMNPLQQARYEEVRNKMSNCLAHEEAFWRQRAKVYWLKDGDTNSRFFHATASSKRRRNEVTKLQNNEGVVVKAQHEICEVVKDYFVTLFSSTHREMHPMLNHITPSITYEDNTKLTAPFQIHEFKKALFSMHSDKAPGPDGLNPAFYKRFWG